MLFKTGAENLAFGVFIVNVVSGLPNDVDVPVVDGNVGNLKRNFKSLGNNHVDQVGDFDSFILCRSVELLSFVDYF